MMTKILALTSWIVLLSGTAFAQGTQTSVGIQKSAEGNPPQITVTITVTGGGGGLTPVTLDRWEFKDANGNDLPDTPIGDSFQVGSSSTSVTYVLQSGGDPGERNSAPPGAAEVQIVTAGGQMSGFIDL